MGIRQNSFFCPSASRQIENCETADEFYSTMGRLTQEMLEHDLLESHELMQVSGQLGPAVARGLGHRGSQQSRAVVLGKVFGQPSDLIFQLTKSLYIIW